MPVRPLCHSNDWSQLVHLLLWAAVSRKQCGQTTVLARPDSQSGLPVKAGRPRCDNSESSKMSSSFRQRPDAMASAVNTFTLNSHFPLSMRNSVLSEMPVSTATSLVVKCRLSRIACSLCAMVLLRKERRIGVIQLYYSINYYRVQ